ncbi:hypothetical protein V2J09_015412 [Rumex salicifolius]
MADRKRKSRDESKKKRDTTKKKSKQSKSKILADSDVQNGGERKKSGPRLPNALKREVDTLNPNSMASDEDDVFSGDEGGGIIGDVYEYEEEVAEEESKKNRRYDRVEDYNYQLPEDFEDEDVLSEDDNDEANDGRHSRLLQGVTGMPAQVFEGIKRKGNFVVSEAYPESEYNPTSDVLAGKGNLSIQDFLEPLHDMPGYSKLKKKMQNVEKEMPLQAPLPKPVQDKIQRAVVYDHSKKEVTKWEPLVKRNREAPTLYFDENIDIGFSTVGAIASEFKPRTDFEKKIASLVHIDEVTEAESKDGAKLLELNKVSAEEVKDRQNRLAKMRSLLFRHEMKSKHVKKIKSKTYHRLLKKDRLKAAGLDMDTDPEAVKELARKQEFERAEERMRLKHKNTSKWAKRIIRRGPDVQDEGTRAAIQEQLREHQRLTRKMNSMKDTSSGSDDSTDEDEDVSDGSDTEDALKLLDKASEKTKLLMDEDDEIPKSSLFALPFMARGLAKKKEAANEEAKLALQEYEALKNKVDKTEPEGSIASGRRVFGATQKHERESKADHIPISNARSDDSDNEHDTIEEPEARPMGRKEFPTDTNVDLNALREDLETADDSLFKTMDDIVKQPGARTAYDVAIFASGSWKKMNDEGKELARTNSRCNYQEAGKPALENVSREEPYEHLDENSDSESEGQMIDGILTSGTEEKYELPSQEELIRRAFAGDDVEEEFERAKEEALDEENPRPEEPSLMPGWGQWASTKKKRGLPSWMRDEHENAKKKREEVLKKRKDANLKHVIISEKVDKKAEKLHTKTLPYPFTSKEVFEQSIRMPIGPEYNPATTFRAISRPEVVKRPGIIIKPISFEEVNPHEGAADDKKKRTGRKTNTKGKNGAKNKALVRVKSK